MYNKGRCGKDVRMHTAMEIASNKLIINLGTYRRNGSGGNVWNAQIISESKVNKTNRDSNCRNYVKFMEGKIINSTKKSRDLVPSITRRKLLHLFNFSPREWRGWCPFYTLKQNYYFCSVTKSKENDYLGQLFGGGSNCCFTIYKTKRSTWYECASSIKWMLHWNWNLLKSTKDIS